MRLEADACGAGWVPMRSRCFWPRRRGKHREPQVRKERVMIQLCHGSIAFPALRDRGPDVRNSLPCHFSGPVRQACCVLEGFDYGYTDGDHHVWRTTVQLDCRIDGDVVTVIGTFGFRDSSGNWDDRYDGNVRFCVIADVQPRTPDFVSRIPYYGVAGLFHSHEAAAIVAEALPKGESSTAA